MIIIFTIHINLLAAGGEGVRCGRVRLVTIFKGSILGPKLIAMKQKPNFPLDVEGKKRCHSTLLFTWKPQEIQT